MFHRADVLDYVNLTFPHYMTCLQERLLSHVMKIKGE